MLHFVKNLVTFQDDKTEKKKKKTQFLTSVFLLANFHTLVTKQKPQVLIVQGHFLRKNYKKSPYFEEKKSHVAIFRQWVPIGHQKSLAKTFFKSTLLSDL